MRKSILSLLLLIGFLSNSQTKTPLTQIKPAATSGSLIITGTGGIPTYTGTINVSKVNDAVSLNGSETLTNKSITSPTITGVTTQSNTTFNGYVNQAKSANAASSSTVDLSTVTGNLVHITGTTTINSFGTVQAGAERTIVFDDVLTVTSNTASLILPGNTSILTDTNDVMVVRSEGSGNWRCVSYLKNDEKFIRYTSTITGYSVTPSHLAYYKMTSRNTYELYFVVSAVGNSTSLTFTLPFNFPAAFTVSPPIPVWVLDNATGSIGYLQFTAGSNICTVNKISGVFTSGVTKSVRLFTPLPADL